MRSARTGSTVTASKGDENSRLLLFVVPRGTIVLLSLRPGRVAATFWNFPTSLGIFPQNLCIGSNLISCYLQPERDTCPHVLF